MIKKFFLNILYNKIQLSNLPEFIRKFIDIDSYKRELFIIQCSKETPKNGIVLDAGAGECQYKKHFSNQTYIAADFGLGEKNWKYNCLDVITKLENLPFRNSSFDSIICTQVLEHLPEPQIVLNEFYRVLKKNGHLYISVPQGWCVHQAPYDFYRFTNYGLKYLLEKSNFKIDYIKPTTGYFGYLANRFLFFPKIFFWSIQKKFLRVILLPFELISYIIFVFLLPLIFNLLDFIDKNKDFTLNYLVKAHKSPN